MEGAYDTANQVPQTQTQTQTIATTNPYSSDLPNYLNASEVMENSYELIDYFKTEVENYELNNPTTTTNDSLPITDRIHTNEMEMEMELPMYVENDINVNRQHDYYLDNNQQINESPMILPSFQVSDKIFELPPLEMEQSNMGMNYFNPNQMNFVQNEMMFTSQNPPNGTNGNVKSDTSDSTLSTPDGLKTGQNANVNNSCINMNRGMMYNNLNRYDLNFYNNMYDINSRMNYTSSYPPANSNLHPQTTYRLPSHPSHPHTSASFDQSYDQGYDPRLMGFRMPNSSMYSLGMSLPYHTHSNLMHPAYQTKPVPQVNKRYRCNLCGKGFSRPSSLTTHTYSHTGEKPFKCTVEGCGRSFSVVSNLRRHGKVHMNQH